VNALRKHALDVAAFIWGVAEATLFFFVPDVLLSYIGVKRGVKGAARASLIAAIGAGVGGVIMYLWSTSDPGAAREAVLAVPAISEAMAARAESAMAAQGWFVATLFGPLSSTPYKVYAIFAPHAGAPLPLFVLASIIARLPRFLIVGCGVALIGRWLEPRLGPQRVLWVLIGAWIAFYAVFFALVPS
jgi:membrane protein YqaA with SNARE-associated domain